MALSRIWSAFILIALSVASYQFIFNSSKDDVFGKMVTGSSKDELKYVAIGNIAKYGKPSIDSFSKEMAPYGFKKQDKVDDETKFIVTDNIKADTVLQLQQKFTALRAVEYSYILGKKQKPVDGIIATCKVAVDICLGLIGIMGLFMGFMSIAEKAGGIRFLSKIVGPFFSKLFPKFQKVILHMVT
jgi:hypothetical protein